ncbi:MAG: hypothetical protein EOO05_05915 [Chitinophagaceae bacterium]|nr:MAG: hypothetical protein EOO05_05915 [Chitinophagaceae bacterium]
MKPKSITLSRPFSALAIVAGTVALLSWNHTSIHEGRPVNETSRNPALNLERLMSDYAGFQENDTTPIRNKKPRDIDEAIEELDKVNIDAEMEQAMKSMKIAMEQIDEKKIQAEVDKAMKSVDMEKIKKQVQESMSKIDWVEMKKTIDESIARIDWKQIQASMDEVKKINWAEIQDEMKKARVEIEKQGPQIKLEMEKAKGEIAKAKTQLKEFKVFIDGLEKDGLINKKDGYTLDHKDGEFKINGKKASDETQEKYKSFLEKHDSFHIQVKDGEFDMNDGSWNSDDDDDDDSVVS